MEAVPLGLDHERALHSFLQDFDEAGEAHVPAFFADPDASHAEVVARFAAWSRGEDMIEGHVPCTTSFLVHESEILGVVNLRHELTPALEDHGGNVGYSVRPSARGKGCATRLLEAAMEQARQLGLTKLLITCDTENIASYRVIEKCGGVLTREELYEPLQVVVRSYWITL